MRTHVLRFAASLLIGAPASLRAQSPATLVWIDAGGARVQQPTGAPRAAASLGGGLWHARRSMAVAGEGVVTVANDSVSASQFVWRTTWLPRSWARTDLDASATSIGGISPLGNGNRALALRQTLRHRTSVGSVALFGMAGTGTTSRMGAGRRGHVVGGGAEWDATTASGSWRGGLTVQRSETNDFRLMEASSIYLARVAPVYTLRDVALEASWQRGSWWLHASRGWRAGTGLTVGSARAVNVSAAFNATAAATFIVQGGEQLADVVRGVPQARYIGAAIRWTPVRPTRLRRDVRALADTRGGSSGDITTLTDIRGDEVQVQREAGRGTVVITIQAPPEAIVEIATSAGEWTPVRMSRDGSAFVHRVTLTSGSYRLAVRIDDGPWRAPYGLVVVNDDFGGQAGLLVVP